MTYRKLLLLLALCIGLAGCGGQARSGDRVLVTKCDYEFGLRQPRRTDVVVFKYPERPTKHVVPTNYIKRLWGLPGELIAIFFGRLYHRPPQPNEAPLYDDLTKDVPATDLWKREYTHSDDEKSTALFERGEAAGFEILRKEPSVMMALRRIVCDNDFQPKDLIGKLPPRWDPARTKDWKADGPTAFAHKGGADEPTDWLRYQHIVRPAHNLVGADSARPRLITDVMGYNSARLGNGPGDLDDREERFPQTQHWVGDLMLECQLDVTEPKGEFCLELSKSTHRFQACWDLATGMCSLYKLTGTDPATMKKEPLGSPTQTRVKAPGSYNLRFANIDARLTVWVDRDLPFDDGVAYPPPEIRGKDEQDLPKEKLLERRGPTVNDLEPASIGSRGARVKIAHLRLWRDTYYTASEQRPDYDIEMRPEDWAGSDKNGRNEKWDYLRTQHFRTMFVQPGHYLVLGDNSPASADSRNWGLVPDRLMLGRALVVYYPFDRAGAIR